MYLVSKTALVAASIFVFSSSFLNAGASVSQGGGDDEPLVCGQCPASLEILFKHPPLGITPFFSAIDDRSWS